MAKEGLNSEPIKKLLNIMLNNTQKYYTYKDFRRAFPDMSETSIRTPLRELKDNGILDVSRSRGKPAGKDDTNLKYYRISNSIHAFEELFSIYFGKDIKFLLDSRYIKTLLNNNQFTEVYDILSEKFNVIDFRKIASTVLLNHPSIIKEYQEIANTIYNHYLYVKEPKPNSNQEIRPKFTNRYPIWNAIVGGRDDVMNLMINDNAPAIISKFQSPLKQIYSKHIEMLQTFCPLEAIGLYREAIAPRLLDLCDELNKASKISDGLNQFLELDIELSPYTSFPFNNPQSLLSNSHFQRIFDNGYFLEPKDRDFFAIRALAIYDNFADILFELYRNILPSNQMVLAEQTRQFIFEWNVASTNLDSIWLFLDSIYGINGNSVKFYIRRSDTGLQIRDLETNRSFIDDDGREVELSSQPIVIRNPWDSYGGAEYMENPFNHLRPCSCFYSYLGNMEFIPIEDILSDLKSRFADRGLDYDKLKK